MAGDVEIVALKAQAASGQSLVVIYSSAGALGLLLLYDAARFAFPERWHARLWLYEHIYKMVATLAGMLSVATCCHLHSHGRKIYLPLPGYLRLLSCGGARPPPREPLNSVCGTASCKAASSGTRCAKTPYERQKKYFVTVTFS